MGVLCSTLMVYSLVEMSALDKEYSKPLSPATYKKGKEEHPCDDQAVLALETTEAVLRLDV